jgi:hypothetical protein
VAFADLTDPEAVRAAMRQYDELGQETFLAREEVLRRTRAVVRRLIEDEVKPPPHIRR